MGKFLISMAGLFVAAWMASGPWVHAADTDADNAILFHVEKKPVTAEDYLRQGEKHVFKSEYEKAVRAYQHAIKLAPEKPDAYQALGDVYLLQGRMHFNTWNDMNQRIRINPTDAQAAHYRGDAQRNLEKYFSLAISNFSKAIRQDPGSWYGYMMRGIANYEKNRINIMQSYLGMAIEDFNQVLALKPDQQDAVKYRGLCYSLNGNHAEAYKDFEKLLIQNADNAEVQFYMGECCERLKKRDAARASYLACARMAGNLDPGLADEAARRAARLK